MATAPSSFPVFPATTTLPPPFPSTAYSPPGFAPYAPTTNPPPGLTSEPVPAYNPPPPSFPYAYYSYTLPTAAYPSPPGFYPYPAPPPGFSPIPPFGYQLPSAPCPYPPSVTAYTPPPPTGTQRRRLPHPDAPPAKTQTTSMPELVLQDNEVDDPHRFSSASTTTAAPTSYLLELPATAPLCAPQHQTTGPCVDWTPSSSTTNKNDVPDVFVTRPKPSSKLDSVRFTAPPRRPASTALNRSDRDTPLLFESVSYTTASPPTFPIDRGKNSLVPNCYPYDSASSVEHRQVPIVQAGKGETDGPPNTEYQQHLGSGSQSNCDMIARIQAKMESISEKLSQHIKRMEEAAKPAGITVSLKHPFAGSSTAIYAAPQMFSEMPVQQSDNTACPCREQSSELPDTSAAVTSSAHSVDRSQVAPQVPIDAPLEQQTTEVEQYQSHHVPIDAVLGSKTGYISVSKLLAMHTSTVADNALDDATRTTRDPGAFAPLLLLLSASCPNSPNVGFTEQELMTHVLAVKLSEGAARLRVIPLDTTSEVPARLHILPDACPAEQVPFVQQSIQLSTHGIWLEILKPENSVRQIACPQWDPGILYSSHLESAWTAENTTTAATKLKCKNVNNHDLAQVLVVNSDLNTADLPLSVSSILCIIDRLLVKGNGLSSQLLWHSQSWYTTLKATAVCHVFKIQLRMRKTSLTWDPGIVRMRTGGMSSSSISSSNALCLPITTTAYIRQIVSPGDIKQTGKHEALLYKLVYCFAAMHSSAFGLDWTETQRASKQHFDKQLIDETSEVLITYSIFACLLSEQVKLPSCCSNMFQSTAIHIPTATTVCIELVQRCGEIIEDQKDVAAWCQVMIIHLPMGSASYVWDPGTKSVGYKSWLLSTDEKTNWHINCKYYTVAHWLIQFQPP